MGEEIPTESYFSFSDLEEKAKRKKTILEVLNCNKSELAILHVSIVPVFCSNDIVFPRTPLWLGRWSLAREKSDLREY